LFRIALRHEIAEVARVVCSDILPGEDMALEFAEVEPIDAEAILPGD
jgi:hypothetical protein